MSKQVKFPPINPMHGFYGTAFRHADWSKKHVDAQTVKGILDHIEKEVCEIEAQPTDREEWVDLILLGMDGYRKFGGGNVMNLILDLDKKVRKLEARKYTMTDPDKACEHDRSYDVV